MKKFIITFCLIGFGLISLIACFLRYSYLDRVPYGFHIDEMSGSVDIGCMTTEGVDAHNVAHPLFSNLNYGTPKPPTYIYPGIVWSRIFGYSVPSLRAFGVTVHIVGIAGLFFLARLFFGWRYAFITVAVASLSPWTWNVSRVAFESLFAVTFLIWGLYFFFKPSKISHIFFAALFFVAAVYSYPPTRLQVPLMLTMLLTYIYARKLWPVKGWVVFVLTFILPVIPLVQKILNGEIQHRFNSISIFSKQYLDSIHSSGSLQDVAGIFINNYLLHFKMDFLFLKGDPSYVHSTGHFGILSWIDTAGLILAGVWLGMLLIEKCRVNHPFIRYPYFLLFLIVNIFVGVLPSALTNSELPNTLRITGAWPFMCLLTGFFIWQSCERWWGLWIASFVLSLSFAVVFFNVYFKVYPQEGKGMFAYWTLDQANQIKSDEDWLKFVMLYRRQDYNARYFLMQYRHVSCTQSRNMWEGVNRLLSSRGID